MRLNDILFPQYLKYSNEVEILQYMDSGEVSIGYKRQHMLESAQGIWVVSIDDDDLVSSNYLSLLLKEIESHPDAQAIAIGGFYRIPRLKEKPFICQFGTTKIVKYSKYVTQPINHLCPVRTAIARKAGFPDQSGMEDIEYANRLIPLLDPNKVVLMSDPIYIITGEHPHASK